MKKNNIDNVFQFVRLNNLNEFKKTVDRDNVNLYINEYNQNLLHEAISNNSLDIIDYLFKINININYQDEEGKTPLHYAVLYKNIYTINLLLSNKLINKNISDIYGNNSMWIAVFNARGEYDIVKLLKKYDVDYLSKNNNGMSPLDFAKNIEDIELINILLN